MKFKINFLPKKKTFILILLAALAIIVFFLRLKNLDKLSLWMDEGFYYLAAERILHSGYPLYPSGHILYKGILYSYLLSFFSLIFGFNEFNLRLFSVLVSVTLLPIFYFFAKKFVKEELAFLGVLIIAFSTWETEYSRTVIYFAPLQLIYLLSLYFFYKGYFEDQKKYQILALFSFLLAPPVSQLAMGLWFSFAALFLVKGAKRFFKKDVLLPFFLVTLAYLFYQLHETLFWKVGYVFEKEIHTFREFLSYFFTGFSFTYFKEILRSFPQMGLFIFFGFFLFLGEYSVFGNKEDREKRFYEGWLFLNLSLLFPLLFFGFFRTHVQPRYLFQLRPLMILLYVICLWRTIKIIGRLILRPFSLGEKRKLANPLSMALFIICLFLFTDQVSLKKVLKIIHRNYKDLISTDVITRSGRFEHYDHKGVGSYVRHYLRQDDIVIAIHVVFQYIYAGRVDYWLWSGGPGTWDAWESTPQGWKDVYIGARWINNLADLRKLIEENPQRRVWLIASPSLLRRDHISAEIFEYLQSQKDKILFRGKDGMSEVYLWNDENLSFPGEKHIFEGEWAPVTFGQISFSDDASMGCALFLDKGKDKRKIIAIDLPQNYSSGRYRLLFRMKREEGVFPISLSEKIIKGEVLVKKGKSVLQTFTVDVSDFKNPGRYQDFSFRFYLPRESPLSLRIFYRGGVSLWIDFLDLIFQEERSLE